MYNLDHLQSVVVAAFAGAMGAVGLGLLYRGLKSGWPQVYGSPRGWSQTFERYSLARFLMLRVTPVTVGALVISETLERSQKPAAVGLLVYWLVHVYRTHGTALRDQQNRHPSAIVYHISLALALGAAVFAVLRLPTSVSRLIPQPSELNLALWTGAFAALFGRGISVILQEGLRSHDEKVEDRLLKDIGTQSLNYVREMAWKYDTSAVLLEGIVRSEAQQRPRWFRDLERRASPLLGWYRGGATYGVAQMWSEAPLTDAESIERLAQEFEGYKVPIISSRAGARQVNSAQLVCRLENHNSSPTFLGAVMDHLEQQRYANWRASREEDKTGMPRVRILSARRRGSACVLFGDASPDVVSVAISGAVHARMNSPASMRRWEWRHEQSLAADELKIEFSTEDGSSGDLDLHIVDILVL